MRTRVLLGGILAVGGSIATATPIGQPPDLADLSPRLAVETSLVMLPVTVVDQQGGLVPDLVQEAFTIYDGGTPRPIVYFASDDLPAVVGFVVDSSGSMRGRRERVTSAASAFVEASHPLDELFAVNFNERAWAGLPAQTAFADTAEQLRLALARAPVHGMTALHDAVIEALDHLALGTHARKALIVVSDGGDNASRHTFDEVLERARQTSASIYSVVMVSADDRDAKPRVLKDLARETGGSAFTPRTDQEMRETFKRVAQEIRTGYTLGFEPLSRAERGFNPIRVVVEGRGRRLVARTRVGYYAGPSGRRSNER